jgi:hypothetical protein
MTYNIESIISDLTKGKSETEIAQELSGMLNDAIKLKKAQDEEAELKRKEAEAKVASKKRQEDIQSCAVEIFDGILSYLIAVEANEIYDAIMSKYEDYVSELTDLLIKFADLLPLYKQIFNITANFASAESQLTRTSPTTHFTSKTKATASPAMSKRANSVPQIKVTKDNIDLFTESEIDKTLEDLIKDLLNMPNQPEF